MKDIIKSIIIEFQQRTLPKMQKRDLVITFDQKIDLTIDDINIQIILFYEWAKLLKTLY